MNGDGTFQGGAVATKVYGRVWTIGRFSLAMWRKPSTTPFPWRDSLRGLGWAILWAVGCLISSAGVVGIRADGFWLMVVGLMLAYGGMSLLSRSFDGIWDSCKAMRRALDR